MDESDIRNEVSEVLYSAGIIPYHPPDMRPFFKEKDGEKKENEEEKKDKKERRQRGFGRLDLLGGNPAGETVLVEVKDVIMLDGPKVGHNGILYFKEISKSQRETLDRWVYHLYGTGFLAVGTIENGNIKRRLWLIPWSEWVTAELELFNQGFMGMPIVSSRHMGFTDYFEAFELEWIGVKEKLHWKLQDDHPLMQIKRRIIPENQYEPISLRFT